MDTPFAEAALLSLSNEERRRDVSFVGGRDIPALLVASGISSFPPNFTASRTFEVEVWCASSLVAKGGPGIAAPSKGNAAVFSSWSSAHSLLVE
jgi:hypothetical protein